MEISGYKPVSELLADALYFKSNYDRFETGPLVQNLCDILDSLTHPTFDHIFQATLSGVILSIPSNPAELNKSVGTNKAVSDCAMNFDFNDARLDVHYYLTMWRL